jgi:hypothetical protein
MRAPVGMIGLHPTVRGRYIGLSRAWNELWLWLRRCMRDTEVVEEGLELAGEGGGVGGCGGGT